ncbi:MAG: hypothetical protein C4581_00150 [Nitrospiraceae bacterium]|nr:MAG: hypothetical protein C4581_00150 [Nitrospiraceae bacterium]
MEPFDKKKEILKALALLREYAQGRGGEEKFPVRINYIDQYIAEYSKPNPNINWRTFADFHDLKAEATIVQDAVKSYKRSFLNFMNKYFETEGRNAPYRLTYEEKGYYLKPIKNPFAVTSSDTGISYSESKHFETRYRPVLLQVFKAVCFIIALLSLYFGVAIFWTTQQLSFILLGMLSITIAILTGLIAIPLFMLQEDKFTFIFYSDYFLRLIDQRISLASYSGECPLCGGTVKLMLSLIQWRGYIGKCQNFPRRHVYSFDDSSLSGELLIKNCSPQFKVKRRGIDS